MSTSRERFTPPPPPPPPPPPRPPSESVAGYANKPSDFAAAASKMGREVSKIPGIFRTGAILLLVGALIVAGQNALVLTNVAQVGLGTGFAAPGNASAANNTVNDINATAGNFLNILSIATMLDLAGFSLMGLGCFLLAIGSLRIEFRMRFDGSTRKMGRSSFAGFLIAGIFLFAWVGITANWRSALTGSPTGNWSILLGIFDTQSVSSGSGFSPELTAFFEAFPRASMLWLVATVMLLPAAIGFFVGARSLRRGTGVKVGGAAFLVFSIAAFASVIAFSFFIMQLLGTVQQSGAGGGGGSGGGFGEAFQSLIIAVAIKLFVVPIWAVIGAIAMALTGLRLMRLAPGKVVLAAEDVKAITEAAAPGAGGSAGGAPQEGYPYPPPPPPPPMGDEKIMVTLPGAANKPRLDGGAPPVPPSSSWPPPPPPPPTI